MSTVQAILTFWFGDPAIEDVRYETRRKLWFTKSAETDQRIRDRFLTVYEQAARSELDSWQNASESCLALLIVLDQFPRNIFRDTPQAFATDAKALAIAKEALDRGLDQQLTSLQRVFMYLPLEHSENSQDQVRSVSLMRQLYEQNPELNDVYDYALKHQVVIDRFGRFPHRNAILGRETTPEEAEFLRQPGSSF